jgi:uncharacterized membrane protein YeaQ/YmgE (transglycosylase-associated protein family)
MALVNCLWVGVLAGLVGTRLIRVRGAFVAPASSVAVGVLGALVGLLVDGWLGRGGSRLLHGEIIVAGLGAAAMLAAWSVAQRVVVAQSRRDMRRRVRQADDYRQRPLP